MRTSELYSLLWSQPRLTEYVMAVGPSPILRHITFTSSENAYIINVTAKGDGKGACNKKRRRRRRKHSPEGLQGTQGFRGPVDVLGGCSTRGNGRGRRRRRRRRRVGRGTGHWIVLVVADDGCEIFDSLGTSDVSGYGEEEITQFVKMYNCHFVNDVLLSSIDCGYFCLLFCYYKCTGYSTHQTIAELKRCKISVKDTCEKVFRS